MSTEGSRLTGGKHAIYLWHRMRNLNLQIQKDILEPVFVIMNRGGVSVLNYAHYGSKQSLTSFQLANYKRFKITAEISLPLLETKEVLN